MTGGPGDLDNLAGLLERGDPDRFRALLAAPPTARPVLLPLYAFNLEVARAPWASAEPMIAEMRLQFWRDVLEEIAGGGEVRRHEVATPLAMVLDAEGARLLDPLVAARRWDCYREPFEGADHFNRYIHDTYGRLIWVAARALGATEAGPVEDFGAAAGRAAFLLAVPDLLSRGRQPLAHTDDPAAIARDGQAVLARGRGARGRIPRAARAALLPGWRAPDILARAAADAGRVTAGDLAEAEARKRLRLILAALRGTI